MFSEIWQKEGWWEEEEEESESDPYSQGTVQCGCFQY